MRPLRIAQVCADRGVAPGGTKGAALHLRGIARGFQALGHEVTTFAARPAEGEFPAPLRAIKHLATAEFDVLYERYSLAHQDGLLEARRRGLPFVLEVNAPLVMEASRYRPETLTVAAQRVEKRLLEEADLVVAVSRPLAAWVAHRRSGPVAVVPNGFEPEWFASEARPEDGTLVFCGHPKPWHGAGALVPVLRLLHARGLAARLLVIGGGPGAEALVEQARASGLDQHVAVTGAVPPARAAALLRSASIGLAPYPSTEQFYFSPLKVIDYLAAGLPAVATALGDIPELVGDAGIAVEAGDLEAFATAVEELLTDTARRQEMGRRGRERAHRTMTWAHAAGATLEALGRVMSQRVVPTGARA